MAAVQEGGMLETADCPRTYVARVQISAAGYRMASTELYLLL